jgi:hypothetical protein
LEQGARGTNADTGGIGTVIAAQDGKMPADVGERPLIDAFDPCSKAAERDLVLGFAGNGARMAADAATIVDDKTIIHWQIRRNTTQPSPGRSQIRSLSSPNLKCNGGLDMTTSTRKEGESTNYMNRKGFENFTSWFVPSLSFSLLWILGFYRELRRLAEVDLGSLHRWRTLARQLRA